MPCPGVPFQALCQSEGWDLGSCHPAVLWLCDACTSGTQEGLTGAVMVRALHLHLSPCTRYHHRGVRGPGVGPSVLSLCAQGWALEQRPVWASPGSRVTPIPLNSVHAPCHRHGRGQVQLCCAGHAGALAAGRRRGEDIQPHRRGPGLVEGRDERAGEWGRPRPPPRSRAQTRARR